MTIRIKLLFSFLILSLLMMLMTIIDYYQIKKVMFPLTTSIPMNTAQLENAITQDTLIQNLLYSQVMINRSVENYAFSGKIKWQQQYYLYDSLFEYTLQNLHGTLAIRQWELLENKYHNLQQIHLQIIKFVDNKNLVKAQLLLNNGGYTQLRNQFDILLENYARQHDVLSNETLAITVRMAAKDAQQVLQQSMRHDILYSIAILILSVLLALVLSYKISAPIQSLRKNFETITPNHFHLKIDTSLLKLKDEVGEFARSFSSMLQQLHTTTVSRNELIAEVERRQRTEIELRKTTESLQKSNKELEQFAYVTSHDLRAPLRGIKQLVNWIEEDNTPLLTTGKTHEYFTLLTNRVFRMEQLINGILQYSRINQVVVNVETISVKNLLMDIIEQLAPPSHIKIIIEENMPTLQTVVVLFSQVFSNLINNAIKYNNKSQGKIIISAKMINDNYQFAVKDNGPGIAPEFHERIFDLFQTLQSRDKIESTGIGLAIVKKILAGVGSSIWLESTGTDEGTAFYFTWPTKWSFNK